MYGVYFIHASDSNWSLAGTTETFSEAESLMGNVGYVLKEYWNMPPFCLAISAGQSNIEVERGELSGVTA